MAREEADREDLLRDATALVERIELRGAAGGPGVVCGFRRCGAASFFLGSDPVYQFNSAGQLRRAFVDGLLYKADRGQLVALRRARTASGSSLLSHALSDAEQVRFLATAEHHLRRLAEQLARGEYQIAGQVPADVAVFERVCNWLAARTSLTVAASPRVS